MGAPTEMPSLTRYWLILLAIVLAGAAAHTTMPLHGVMPASGVLAYFPAQLGPYSVTRSEFSDSQATRRAYAPAVIVYRDYSNGQGEPINLFIGPEPVGWDSPSICATYRGSVITQLATRPVATVPDLVITQVVLRSREEDPMNICAYYWRGENGPLNDSGFQLLKGKLAVLAGFSSFRVDMCTQVNDASELASAAERLSTFAGLVDPEVQHLLHQAVASGKQATNP